MTDVIKNVNSSSQVASGNAKSAPRGPENSDNASAAQKAEAAVTGNEQVELTGAAKRLDEVVANLNSEPVVDRQKVEAIKQALAEGRYQVDSAVVAQKLIEIDELLK